MADQQIQQSDMGMKRRGLFAAAAAVVAGIVAKLAEAPVFATTGSGDQGFLALGSNPWYISGLASPNAPAVASAPTVVQASANFGNFAGNNGADPVVFEVDARPSSGVVDAIYGLSDGSGYGVYGKGLYGVNGSGTNTGVYGSGPTGVVGSGQTTGVAGSGTTGVAGSGTSIGVSGTGATGVLGQSTSGTPILGQVPASSSSNTIAIYGQNNSSYSGPGPGAGGFGVYGLSAKGHGLVGATAAVGAAAIVGATNGVVGALAGAFYGPVVIGGSFTVVGGAKSAAVPHPDGSLRRLYCMESPESWFEDFGKGQLECGRVEITIDPDFAAVTDLSDYHVFLTEHDTHQHLSVADQTAIGFSVEADLEMAALKGKRDADLNGRFSWRVVAKRKDIKGERLETVTIPPEPTLPPPMEIVDLTNESGRQPEPRTPRLPTSALRTPR